MKEKDVLNNMKSIRSLFDFDLALIPSYAKDYGLFFPADNIDSSIHTIVRSNCLDSPWDKDVLIDLIDYYLFSPVLVTLMREDWDTYYYPFRYCAETLEGVADLGSQNGLKVLQAGCASEESALCGYEMVEKLFGTDNLLSFEMIDLCSIPVKRISEFMELRPFAKGVEFEARVQSIEHLSGEFLYDIIITDRLLGSSPRKEYCIGILNRIYSLLEDGGKFITVVDGESETTPPQPHLSGEICYDLFCHRYGNTGESRDAKIGLTKQQWDLLSRRYYQKGIAISNNTCIWSIRNLHDVVRLFHSAGFDKLRIKKLFLSTNSYEDVSIHRKNLGDIEGSFIVCATK